MTRTTYTKPRGWFAKLLREAGFTPGISPVDPPSGNIMHLPGSRATWLRALKDVEEADLQDYRRAVGCVMSQGCKKSLDLQAAMFIDGVFYIQYEGENQIERWFPTRETKELRDNFDKGEVPPNRFLMAFRAAEGSERLTHQRRISKARSLTEARTTRKTNGRRSHRTIGRVLDTNIRNGILIAERI